MLYVELVGLTGPYRTLPTQNDKRRHWDQIVAASAGQSNVLLGSS